MNVAFQNQDGDIVALAWNAADHRDNVVRLQKIQVRAKVDAFAISLFANVSSGNNRIGRHEHPACAKVGPFPPSAHSDTFGIYVNVAGAQRAKGKRPKKIGLDVRERLWNCKLNSGQPLFLRGSRGRIGSNLPQPHRGALISEYQRFGTLLFTS